MSLRLRLLVAVGLISMVALVVADFATYSALRSSLYQQVDQQLAGTTPESPFTRRTGIRLPVAHGPRFGIRAAAGADRRRGRGRRLPECVRVLLRRLLSTSSGTGVNGHRVPGLRRQPFVSPAAARADHRILYPARRQPGRPTSPQALSIPSGPAFRVRAVKVSSCQGGAPTPAVLGQAQPLADQTSTLHTLFLTEFAVTAGALVLALAGGWWLVRLGLRPLEDVEATAESIAAGNLDQRVPGCRPAHRGRSPGPGPQRDARANPGRVLGPRCVRGAPQGVPGTSAPFRGRCIARAAHAHRRRVGLRRALRTWCRHQRDRPASGDRRHPDRDGAHGSARQRPPDAGPAR